MSEITPYLPVAAFALNLLLAWAIWSMRLAFVSRADLDKLGDNVDAVDRRLASVEAEVRHQPTVADIRAVQGQLTSLSAQVAQISAEHRGLERLVERVEVAVTRHEQIFSEAARR